MALRKKKGYKFSDEVMAKDAVISLIFGVPSFVCIVFSIVYSIVVKGNVPDAIGAVLLVALIMAVTAFIFALFSYRDTDGGIISKRGSLIISIIDIAALVALYIL
ncbi:MAG: hypothetical protein K5865_01850 [Eubacterium sp.]|nr:hypothetical protein [Eubacterium sp.]MCR4845466.1 hypothetical protein [Eubacterium sp.]